MEQNVLTEKKQYSCKDKLLLLFTLIMGAMVSWLLVSTDELPLPFHWLFVIFWGVYAVAFLYMNAGKLKGNAYAWFVFIAVCILCARYAVYEQNTLAGLNYLAIPLLLMLHAVVVTSVVPKQRQGQYILRYIWGFTAAPLVNVSQFFGSIGAVFVHGNKTERSRAVRLGVICALPLVIIVGVLLVSSDAALSLQAQSLFNNASLGSLVIRLIITVFVGMLFYSFIYNMTNTSATENRSPYEKRLNPISVNVVTGSLIAVYTFFGVFQFAYLTGLFGLPEGLTYSEYAVRGFSELCAVAAINLLTFAVCNEFTKENKTVRILLGVLLVLTAALLASAAVRLTMYIGAYGLTIKRVLSAWFMLTLFSVLVLCFIKLKKSALPLLRLAMGAIIALYLVLNLINVDAIIAKSVIAKSELNGGLRSEDIVFLSDLSSDADAVIAAAGLEIVE